MADADKDNIRISTINPLELENDDLMQYKEKQVTWAQILGGSIGNILEWYDFAVFGFLAQPIGKAFFPSSSSTAELIKSYGVFAGAFIARPIGGVLFGILGDKMGRKPALQLAMLMMFISTFAMGCLPGYNTFGISAPIILTLLRLFQGMSVGGQLVGSMLFLVESCAEEKRGFYGSLVMMTATIGTMSGAWTATIFETALSEQKMNTFGWRIPFLLSVVIGLIGFISQHRMEGSHEFLHAAKAHKIVRNPFTKAVCVHWRDILYITGIVAPWSAGFYVSFLWLPTYLENEIFPSVEHAFVANSFMFIWICISLLIGGWLCDKFTYFKTMKVSSFCLVLLCFPIYAMIQFLTVDGQIYPLILAQFVIGFTVACYGGPMQICMIDCIDDIVVRYCVMGAGYNLCQALFGGTAPLISTFLAQSHIGFVGLYLSVLSLLAFLLLCWKAKQDH